MTLQQTRQPRGLGAAPAALGREAEIPGIPPRYVDALGVAGSVVMVQQSEIELGSLRPLETLERRIEGVVGAVPRHGNVQEIDAPPGRGGDAGHPLDPNGRILWPNQILVSRR